MRRADNLTTFTCPFSINQGTSTSWNPQGLSRPVMGLLYLHLYKFHFILYDAILLMRSLSTPVLNTGIMPCSQQFLQACSLYFAANTSLARLTPLSTADGISKHCTIALNLASQTYRVYQNAWSTFSTTKQGTVQLKCDGTRRRTGGEVKRKLANGMGSHTLHTTSEHGVSSISGE